MSKPEVEIPDHAPSYQLELEDITVGEGDEATKGSIVEVHYVGVSWKTGNQFDASWDRGDTFKFGLGKGQVIRGWDEGVAGHEGRRPAPDHDPAGHGLRRARRGRGDRPERDAGLRRRPDLGQAIAGAPVGAHGEHDRGDHGQRERGVRQRARGL